MNTFDRIKSELDNLSSNEERKNYLASIKSNPVIPRHDLVRIVANIMEEETVKKKLN